MNTDFIMPAIPDRRMRQVTPRFLRFCIIDRMVQCTRREQKRQCRELSLRRKTKISSSSNGTCTNHVSLPTYTSLHLCRFKLHLRPERLDSQEVNRGNLPPLPLGKTVLQVFADFLGYLFSCTQRYIVDSHASGESIWTSVKDRIEIVLSHPNGWEGLQQGKMREAAILAGLIPNTAAGRARVHFVTEGEASLQYCIHSGLASDSVKVG